MFVKSPSMRVVVREEVKIVNQSLKSLKKEGESPEVDSRQELPRF